MEKKHVDWAYQVFVQISLTLEDYRSQRRHNTLPKTFVRNLSVLNRSYRKLLDIPSDRKMGSDI